MGNVQQTIRDNQEVFDSALIPVPRAVLLQVLEALEGSDTCECQKEGELDAAYQLRLARTYRRTCRDAAPELREVVHPAEPRNAIFNMPMDRVNIPLGAMQIEFLDQDNKPWRPDCGEPMQENRFIVRFDGCPEELTKRVVSVTIPELSYYSEKVLTAKVVFYPFDPMARVLENAKKDSADYA